MGKPCCWQQLKNNQDKSNTLPGLFFIFIFPIFSNVCLQSVEETWCKCFDSGAECGRCCRAAGARNRSAILKLRSEDAEQKYLNVTSLCRSDLQRYKCQINSTVRLFCRSAQWKLSACFGQVELWLTLMGTDSWICCWRMERVPSSQSLSLRSHRSVCASVVEEIFRSCFIVAADWGGANFNYCLLVKANGLAPIWGPQDESEVH